MRELRDSEIAELATRPGVKKMAVENFLFSMPDNITAHGQRANAMMDAKLYRWNAATLDAIMSGIAMAYTVSLARRPVR